MPIDRKPTTWILGAGFSRALGGPLLADLFREEPIDELEAIFPVRQFPLLARDMLWTKYLFNLGKRRGTWPDNPETFVAEVENAWHPPNDADAQRRQGRILALAKAVDSTYGCLLHAELEKRGPRIARRSLAAECSRFILGPYTEVWEPYRIWVDQLDPNLDDIISFNYDCVVEVADRTRGNPQRSAALDQVFPHLGRPIADDSGKRLSLFKLHGSADWAMATTGSGPSGWTKVDGRAFQVKDSESAGATGYHAALLSPEWDVGIAPPGGAKQAFIDENASRLWEGARTYLRRAQKVALLGYSLPASDEMAKQYLLENIGADTQGDVDIHVVLGSDTQLPATRRLVALLATIGPRLARGTFVNGGGSASGTGRIRIWTHAMGAEDFIRQPTFHEQAKISSHVGMGTCLV